MGGLSGPAIKPIALAKVYEVAKSFDIPLVGIGGISTGRDALEFIVAGASAIQVGTENFVQTNATMTILDEIENFLEKEKIPELRDMIRSLSVLQS